MAEAEQQVGGWGSNRSFGIRFESRDDFLVEYTDSLRHGRIRLPIDPPPPSGSGVRLKITLPDGAILYVRGTVASRRVGGDLTLVTLDPLSAEQRQALAACIHGVLGGGEDPAPSPTPAGLGGAGLQVLVVDDSVSHRIELGDVLRERGMRVRVAENGLLGLAAALKKPPDVILTDVEMPQMDGWSLLRSVRQRERLRSIPVVFLTGLSDDLSRLRGYRMGADDFLPKDMVPDEIAARVLGAAARRRSATVKAEAQGLRGELEHVRLGSLLAFLEAERRSGALHLRHGSDSATLHLQNGALARVERLGGSAHPHDRVFELLGWSRGEFDFHAAPIPAQTAQSANDPSATALSYLLMEHARREDESNAF